jgi:uncharacterized ferritin-like protein (DUF455 family)
MKLSELTGSILRGENLEDKLIFDEQIEFDNVISELPKYPARNKKIDFVDKQIKFPKGSFHIDEKKAIALNSFANHELLAIEMMAAALAIYPHHTDELKRFKRGVLVSLRDEQKHFQLYVKRMQQLGYDFGDFPLNDFFWRQMHELDTPSKYLSVMALTFEAANLDFAKSYRDIFTQYDDHQTARILDIVYQDEITHVNLGVRYLNRWKQDKTLWQYYLENLPWPMTPARAKGKVFDEEGRREAQLDEEFIKIMAEYKGDFGVTKRKEWS